MRKLASALRPLLLLFAFASLGGTCSDPPPYRDVSGTWANATWGPSATIKSDDGGVDVDVSLTIKSAVPKTRGRLPVSGTLCVTDAKHGMTGTYTVDPATSTYEGSDYGGGRLDLRAKAQDGRAVEVTQAFMHNASPESLKGAIIVLQPLEGKAIRLAFEDFKRRGDLACP